jgi:glyoxylase I family protein
VFKRIDHIELLTSQPAAIVQFYTDALGFLEREHANIPRTPFGPLDLVYLELGGTTIEVMCYPELHSVSPRNTKTTLGWQCLALEVEEMDAAIDLLMGKGVEVVWGPFKISDYVRAEIRDPDGNPIELREWCR